MFPNGSNSLLGPLLLSPAFTAVVAPAPAAIAATAITATGLRAALRPGRLEGTSTAAARAKARR